MPQDLKWIDKKAKPGLYFANQLKEKAGFQRVASSRIIFHFFSAL